MRGRRPLARGQAGPKHVEGGLNPGMQCRVTIERPDEQRAENGLSKNLRDLGGRKVVADFAAVLTELNHLAMKRMHALLQVHHGFANRSRRKIGLEKRS